MKIVHYSSLEDINIGAKIFGKTVNHTAQYNSFRIFGSKSKFWKTKNCLEYHVFKDNK